MTFLAVDGTRHWLSVSNLLKKWLKWKDVSALTIVITFLYNLKQEKDLQWLLLYVLGVATKKLAPTFVACPCPF